MAAQQFAPQGLAPRGRTPSEALPNRDEQFALAGRLYSEGRFSEAARVWNELVDRGYQSPALYFNLANALIKSGELGEAIVYYERARTLDPRAPDIRANLAYARSLVVDVMPETENSAFLDALVRFKDSISAEEMVRGASALLWLGVGAAAVTRLGRTRLKRVARHVTVGLFIAFGLVGAIAAVKVHDSVGLQRAVLVIPEVAVRAGPGESYSSRFSLHEGTSVRVERQAGDWSEIQLTPTLSGWVPSHVLMSL